MPRRVKVFFDGSSRPAPVGMALAVVARGQTFVRANLGIGSSRTAEWLALIEAVRIARDLGIDDPLFLGDSLAVIDRACAGFAGRDDLTPHEATLARLWPASTPLPIRHVKRTQNLAGIVLARRLDQRLTEETANR
jgi:ribonuclease HI